MFKAGSTHLEDEKVLGLDENVESLERLVVLLVRDRLAVELVFGRASGGDAAVELISSFLLPRATRDSPPLEPPFLPLAVDVDRDNVRLPLSVPLFLPTLFLSTTLLPILPHLLLPFVLLTPAPIHEVLERCRAERGGSNAEDKGDGVHQVRLACSIGTDDGGKGAEGTAVAKGSQQEDAWREARWLSLKGQE